MDPTSVTPQILEQGASEEKGDSARLQSFVGAIAIGDLVKTTLGPKGMDKILQPMPGQGARATKATVTNDGATILRSIWVDNPSAKILVDLSKTQDQQCGDGTTSVVAVPRLGGKPNLDYIQVIEKPGGSLRDSFLEEGFILEKRMAQGMPKEMHDCKVMVANTPMDTEKIKIYGTRVKVDSFEAVAAIEAAEKEKMKDKVEKICKHGCNVFITRQLIYNFPEELFKNNGVCAIEHSDFG